MATNLHDAFDISMPFGEIDGSQFRSSLPMLVVAFENTSCSLTLGTNDSSHFRTKGDDEWLRTSKNGQLRPQCLAADTQRD